jgi:hypothetical protein
MDAIHQLLPKTAALPEGRRRLDFGFGGLTVEIDPRTVTRLA